MIGCLVFFLFAAGIMMCTFAVMSYLHPNDRQTSPLYQAAIGLAFLLAGALAVKLLAVASDRQLAREQSKQVPPPAPRDELIVCSNCGYKHPRAEVVSALKSQSPEMFMFGTWSTRFKCRRCKHEIGISGVGSD